MCIVSSLPRHAGGHAGGQSLRDIHNGKIHALDKTATVLTDEVFQDVFGVRLSAISPSRFRASIMIGTVRDGFLFLLSIAASIIFATAVGPQFAVSAPTSDETRIVSASVVADSVLRFFAPVEAIVASTAYSATASFNKKRFQNKTLVSSIAQRSHHTSSSTIRRHHQRRRRPAASELIENAGVPFLNLGPVEVRITFADSVGNFRAPWNVSSIENSLFEIFHRSVDRRRNRRID
ncbi:MAG: hypothetical protein R3A47_05105 [Polyangiales bacterium]